MTDKLKGLFHGCSHHGDDYEACIQHSGTAPCGVEEERDRFSRLFATACETLGAVQEALGDESSTELTGFEPQLVKKTKEERDALAAHVERLTSELEDRSMTNDPRAASEHYWQLADAIEPYVLDGSLTASVVESHEFLLGLWVAAGKPKSLARLKAQCQAEAIEEIGPNLVDFIDRDYARRVARKLRRQAQEPTQ